MAGKVCDVCGGGAVGVCSSTLGAIGFAYCSQCLRLGVEPWSACVATVWCVPEADLSEAARETIEASLKLLKKSWSDLRAAAIEMDTDYGNVNT